MRQPDILFEDNHLLIVNKAAGIPVQGDESGDESMLDIARKYIAHKYAKPGKVFLHLVHRIDRPVSGLVMMARTSKALERMTQQFRERKVQKWYLAVSKGRPSEEIKRLHHKLFKDRGKNKSYVLRRGQEFDSKDAYTNYRQIGIYADKSLLLVQPKTGRHHQIRVQLSHTGLPIVGDVKYGGPKHDNPKQIMLHSYALQFIHPVRKEPVTLICPPGIGQSWDYFRSLMRRIIIGYHLTYLTKKDNFAAGESHTTSSL